MPMKGKKCQTKIAGDKKNIAFQIVVIEFHSILLLPFTSPSSSSFRPSRLCIFFIVINFPNSRSYNIRYTNNWKRQKQPKPQNISRMNCNFCDEISWLWKCFSRMLMSIAFKCICYFSKSDIRCVSHLKYFACIEYSTHIIPRRLSRIYRRGGHMQRIG